MSFARCAGLAACAVLVGSFAGAQPPGFEKPGGVKPLPPLEKVIEGYQPVSAVAVDAPQSMFKLWRRKDDDSLIAALPRDYAKKRYFIALTLASGSPFAGLQSGDFYVYWKLVDRRLMLVEPNLEIRSNGDRESKSSVERLFTDKVLLDVPVLAMSPEQAPVIDLSNVFMDNIAKFFPMARGANTRLAALKKLKAFPENIELAYEVPSLDGILRQYYFSVSEAPDPAGYKPRNSDPRVGYFTTAFADFGKYKGDETRTRYINRWRLEKADPKLKMSPPKKPIKYYIEHTTPLRYRKWVADGVLYWNTAFEKIGFSNAVQVEFQDPQNGNMNIDPEDVRYNFIRWLNNGIGTAIGPSRVHPETGEILDADVVLTDGWIRSFQSDYNEILPQLAMEGFGPETMAWLEKHPDWDPRLRMRSSGTKPAADPLAAFHVGARGAQCMAASGMAFNLDQLRMTIEVAGVEAKPEDDNVDGIPSSFIGPLLADLVAHEVGHTLGLRHNFKASSIYSLAQINNGEIKGKKPLAGSVMDYIGPNISYVEGKTRGDWSMIGVGPYDHWAIEYGYTTAEDLKPILARVAEPELAFATDEDTFGPDPLARRYDFGANPIEYADSQMKLAKYHRGRLLDKFVKDGDNWQRARKGYLMTLALQTRSLAMISNWVGGSFVHRDFKGDPKARPPMQAAPTDLQRKCLAWVLEYAFKDEHFGLTPELASKLVNDGHYDQFNDEPDFPVHDRVLGVQTSALTMLLNPTRLRRVFDNEFRTPVAEDAFTLPEMLDKITATVWSDFEAAKLDAVKKGQYTDRKPLTSSTRRNLQREHIDRLIDLSLPTKSGAAAYKPIANLSAMQLREIQKKIAAFTALNLDAYTRAHLVDAEARIKKALEATLTINVGAVSAPATFKIFSDGSESNSGSFHPAGCNCSLHRIIAK